MNRRYTTGAVICLALIFALLPAVALAGPLGDLTAPSSTSDAVAVYPAAAVINIAAMDNPGPEVITTGVKTITYKVDDGLAVVANGAAAQVTVSAIGPHTLSYWAEDNDGNIEEVKEAAFTVSDYLAPTTVSDREAAYMDSGVITLTPFEGASESGVASTWFILDDAPAVQGTEVTFDTFGSHTLSFWSVDVAGNEETPIPTSFYVYDTVAPVTVSDAKADYYDSHASIALSASDTKGAGVEATYYAIDGADPVMGTAVVCDVVGEHTLSFWSIDAEGNEEAENTATFTVHAGPVPGTDDVAPVSISDAEAAYTGSPATIKLTTTDEEGGSGIESLFYKVDGGAAVEVPVSVDPPFVPTLMYPITPTVLAPTAHHNNVPAVSYETQTCTPCHADSCKACHGVGPAPEISTDAAKPASHDFITVTPCVDCHVVAAPDPLPRSISKDVVVSGVGNHSIEFWGVDAAGNVETPHKMASFSIGSLIEDTSLTLAAPLVSEYRSAPLRGRLYDDDDDAVGGKTILLEYSYDQVTWTTLSTTVTDKMDGGGYYYEYLAKPKKRTYYRASFAGDAGYEEADSAIVTVLPKVALERTTSWSSISVGKTYTAKGYISPYHGVDYSNKVNIKAYKKGTDDKYHYVKTFAGTYKYYSDSKTIYQANIKFTKSSSKGAWKFVAYHAQDAKNAATAGSADYVTLK